MKLDHRVVHSIQLCTRPLWTTPGVKRQYSIFITKKKVGLMQNDFFEKEYGGVLTRAPIEALPFALQPQTESIPFTPKQVAPSWKYITQHTRQFAKWPSFNLTQHKQILNNLKQAPPHEHPIIFLSEYMREFKKSIFLLEAFECLIMDTIRSTNPLFDNVPRRVGHSLSQAMIESCTTVDQHKRGLRMRPLSDGRAHKHRIMNSQVWSFHKSELSVSELQFLERFRSEDRITELGGITRIPFVDRVTSQPTSFSHVIASEIIPLDARYQFTAETFSNARFRALINHHFFGVVTPVPMITFAAPHIVQFHLGIFDREYLTHWFERGVTGDTKSDTSPPPQCHIITFDGHALPQGFSLLIEEEREKIINTLYLLAEYALQPLDSLPTETKWEHMERVLASSSWKKEKKET